MFRTNCVQFNFLIMVIIIAVFIFSSPGTVSYKSWRKLCLLGWFSIFSLWEAYFPVSQKVFRFGLLNTWALGFHIGSFNTFHFFVNGKLPLSVCRLPILIQFRSCLCLSSRPVFHLLMYIEKPAVQRGARSSFSIHGWFRRALWGLFLNSVLGGLHAKECGFPQHKKYLSTCLVVCDCRSVFPLKCADYIATYAHAARAPGGSGLVDVISIFFF